MKFKQFLIEKLQPSQFRQIVKMWKQSGISKRFDDVFGGKDRIYEPYNGDIDKERKKSKTEEEILYFIRITNQAFPDEFDYEMKDYGRGLIFNKKNKREIKMIKFLDLLIKKFEDYSQKYKDYKSLVTDISKAKKDFTNDKSRALASKSNAYLICYSRHAYDIAGMSTDRGWTSCMELPGKGFGGTNAKYVPLEINAGTIIAYLIKEDDKNIQNPVGRMLIKPYVNDFNPQEVMMVACTGGYGTVPKAMVKQVTAWAVKLNKKIGPGVFRFAGQELTHVDQTIYTRYPQTIEQIKKQWDNVEIYDNPEELIKNFQAYKWFIASYWPTKDKAERKIKIREITGRRKMMVFDVKKMLDNLTMDKYVALYKFGFEDADDFGYEIVKCLKEMSPENNPNEKIQEINDIRTVAYMINDHKYSTEPVTTTEKDYENWLVQNKMLSTMNKKLYEPIKKYYTELKKNMRK